MKTITNWRRSTSSDYFLGIYITALSSATAEHPYPHHHIANVLAEAAPAESPHESIPSDSRSSNTPATTGPRICLLSLFTKTALQDRRKAHPSRQARPSTHAIRSAPDLIGGIRCARYRGVSQAFSTGSASYRLPGSHSRETSLATRFFAKHHNLRMPEAARNGIADESIYGEWSGAAHHQGGEAGYIEQVYLITWWPKLRASRGYGEKLY